MRLRFGVAAAARCCNFSQAARHWLSAAAGAGRRSAHRPPDRARRKALPTIAQRIDFISRALRGTRYRGYTLIGGPRRPEKFVVRDDAFDCVTFCETVLAAAQRQRSRRIRDSAARDPLSQRHRELARAQSLFLRMGPAQHREQDLPPDRHGRRGRHRQDGLLAHGARPAAICDAASSRAPCSWRNKALLANGDIIGFVTRRPNLDYFHIGFVAFGDDGELLLRHASQSWRRVLDESMERFRRA